MPLTLLKRFAGHSDHTDSIGIYGHEYGDDLERGAKIIDMVFGKITTSR